jgi:DNA-binding transcriptional LysR family regulator
VIELRRLRLLHELDRLGTLAAVAESLSLSPSSVSSQLSLLEKELGVPLTEKVGRGVRLTPAALGLIPHIDVMLERLELISTDLASLDAEPRGTVRVASFQSAMIDLVPMMLREVDEHEHLRVEVTQLEPEQAMPALAARGFDLVLGEEFPKFPAPTFPGVVREPLCRDRLQIAIGSDLEVPRSDPGGVVELASLRDLPWIMEPHDTISHAWMLSLCRAAGFEPDVRYESPDQLALVSMVRMGHAVALLPDLFTSRYGSGVRLHPLPDARRLIFAATRNTHGSTPAMRVIRAALRHAAAVIDNNV